MVPKALVLCLVLAASASAAAPSDNCKGTPNMHPVYTDAPTLVSTVHNGAKYKVGPAGLDPQLTIIHVYGTSYEMGQAYGQLLREEIATLLPEVYKYIDAQMAPIIKSLPPSLQKWLNNTAPDLVLNLTMDATAKYIPQHYFDMVHGMSNGTDGDFSWDEFMRVSLFPELIRMSCSMFGAWGPATANTTSELVQLRALDWSTDGPFQQYPLVIVYHPSDPAQNTYSVLTWAGLVGAVTGMNEVGMGISEKVWLHYHGKYSPFGTPTTYVLEDILREDVDTDQALSRVASTNRTASIFIGVGDKRNDHFKVVEYSHTTVNIYNDRNYPTYPNHDAFDSLVFVDKHTQPSSDPCLNALLHQYYGNLDPVTTLRYVTAQFQTGDMHVAIYDFANGAMYVSNASPVSPNGTVVNAYDRPFVRLNMTDLFAVPKPVAPPVVAWV